MPGADARHVFRQGDPVSGPRRPAEQDLESAVGRDVVLRVVDARDAARITAGLAARFDRDGGVDGAGLVRAQAIDAARRERRRVVDRIGVVAVALADRGDLMLGEGMCRRRLELGDQRLLKDVEQMAMPLGDVVWTRDPGGCRQRSVPHAREALEQLVERTSRLAENRAGNGRSRSARFAARTRRARYAADDRQSGEPAQSLQESTSLEVLIDFQTDHPMPTHPTSDHRPKQRPHCTIVDRRDERPLRSSAAAAPTRSGREIRPSTHPVHQHAGRASRPARAQRASRPSGSG